MPDYFGLRALFNAYFTLRVCTAFSFQGKISTGRLVDTQSVHVMENESLEECS